MKRFVAALVVMASTSVLAGTPVSRLAIKAIEGVKIEVDQQTAGEGAASVPVKPGVHTVRMYDGEKLVSERQVEVGNDETVWVEMRVAVKREDKRPVEPSVPTTVEMRSLNVVGDVAVDGVVVGWAPLKVRDLPSGQHTVQVLVDGVPVRTKKMNIKPTSKKVTIL